MTTANGTPVQPSGQLTHPLVPADIRTKKPAKRPGKRPSNGQPPEKRATMPFFAPLAMLVMCVVISIADLAFLNDVVGQVLDVDRNTSLFLSAILGLVGLAFMADLGHREANKDLHPMGTASMVVHFGIWFALGVAIAAARLFSAKILGLGAEDGVTNILGLNIRQQDAVFAPIMLLMYVIAGLGARDAVKALFLNEGFHRFLSSRGEEKDKTKLERQQAGASNRQRIATLNQEREAKRVEVMAAKDAEAKRLLQLKLEREDIAHKEELATMQSKEALAREQLDLQRKGLETEQRALHEQLARAEKTKAYQSAGQSYRQLKSGFEAQTLKITESIALIEKLDAQMSVVSSAFTNSVGIIDESEISMQNAAALKIHAKTQEPVAQLRAIIANFNPTRLRE